ncbi:MAG: M48 family metallopeptidase [bacterium]
MKSLKCCVLGCGCTMVGVAIAGVLLTGAMTGVVGWISGAANRVGVNIPKDIKIPTEIRFPKEIGIPPITLPKLPVNPFKLSAQEQIVLGREVVVKQKLDQDAFDDQRINEIAAQLVKTLPAKYKGPADLGGWEWKFRVLRTKSGEVNAIALPGGKIYVYDGLIKLTDGNNDELAAVISHEMAHVVEEHSAKQLSNAGLLQKATDFLLQNAGGGGGTQEEMIGVLAAQMGQQITQMRLSQSAEYQADDIGFSIMATAGYNPKVGLNILRKLEKLSGEKSSLLSGVFSTHPPTQNRIQRLQKNMASYQSVGKVN